MLPIGGLKEKLLAAHRHGIREAVLPKDNEKDLPDIPENIRKEMKLHFVDLDGRGAEDGARSANWLRCRRNRCEHLAPRVAEENRPH